MAFVATGSLRLPVVISALAALALGALALGGCADSTIEALQQDVAQLRQDLNAATLALHRSRGDTETLIGQLDRRTREQSVETSRQMAALAARLDALAGELAQVSGRVEALGQRVEDVSRQRQSRVVAPPGPSGGPPPVEPRSSQGAPTPEQAYQAASLDLTKGNYPLAVSAFRDFVRRFPDSPLADQAQYGVGEAYFRMGQASLGRGETDKARSELEQSVQEFRRVVLNYPKGGKVPGALYKEALALIELKQNRLAELRLQYLLDNFPQSEEAPLARERLASIRS